MAANPEGLPSLLSVTLRRAIRAGRIYLFLSVVLVVLFSALVLLEDLNAFTAAFPLEVPVFATFGATGAILVFVGDRTGGVFEYLIAYGVPPRRLFSNALVAGAAIAAITLAVSIGAGLVGFLALGGSVSLSFGLYLLLYSIPMTLAATLFSSMCGMIWSTLSSPIAGIDAPVGLTPLIGMAPPILVLTFAMTVPPSSFYSLTAGVVAALVAVVLVLLFTQGRWMRRERVLSPM